jgi:transcriptional regulator with XRE-family HTH domain
LSSGIVGSRTLADTVSRLRLRLGLAVGDLSAKSGVPEHVLRAIEGGDPYVPSEANTVKLAHALRVPAATLLAQRELRARVLWQAP